MTWSNFTDENSSFTARRRTGRRGRIKRLGERVNFAEVAALDLRIVKIVQVIEGPDAVAVAQQAFADVRADEARAAGDEKIHGATLTTPGGRKFVPLAPKISVFATKAIFKIGSRCFFLCHPVEKRDPGLNFSGNCGIIQSATREQVAQFILRDRLMVGQWP